MNLQMLFRPKSRAQSGLQVGLILLVIAYLDYVTGPHIAISAFYLIPISIAAWSLGASYGFAVSVISVGVQIAIGVDTEPVPSSFVLIGWNGIMRLSSAAAFSFAFGYLGELHRALELRVRDRTAALTREIAERERLQLELLDVSEKENQRIGQDLHDGLCQHLAGTAMECQALREMLRENDPGAGAQAERLAKLLDAAVALSRNSAKGLNPVHVNAEGLMSALEELADSTSRLYNVDCVARCGPHVLIKDPFIALNLFRIAQEAVRNAVSHGHAKHIEMQMESSKRGSELRVEDDGVGLRHISEKPLGMGLAIMRQRADAIGGILAVTSAAKGGTLITCTVSDGANNESEILESAEI